MDQTSSKKNVCWIKDKDMFNAYDGSPVDDDDLDDFGLGPLVAIPQTPKSLKRKLDSPIDELLPKKQKEDDLDMEPLIPQPFGHIHVLPDGNDILPGVNVGVHSAATSTADSTLPNLTMPLPDGIKPIQQPKAPKEPKAPKAPKAPKEPKAPKAPKAPKEPKARKEAELPKAGNTRDRPINRCVIKYEEIPQKLVEYLEPNILMKPTHIYEKDTSKGQYQGISPYISHKVQTGWGAQLQNKKRMQMIRIGTFDDIKVAALAFTAAYIDHDLIDEPLKARDWLEDMCKPENAEQLEDWFLLQSIGE